MFSVLCSRHQFIPSSRSVNSQQDEKHHIIFFFCWHSCWSSLFLANLERLLFTSHVGYPISWILGLPPLVDSLILMAELFQQPLVKQRMNCDFPDWVVWLAQLHSIHTLNWSSLNVSRWTSLSWIFQHHPGASNLHQICWEVICYFDSVY